MRAKLWIGLLTIAVAAPTAQALAATHEGDLAVIRDGSSLRAIDTYTRRPGLYDTARGGAHETGSARVVPTTHAATATAAPEISGGLAATALTLLLGTAAVLRGRKSRSRAI
jgi:hypothetical protein